MPDLVVRPSGRPAPQEWSLQLRWHESIGPTEYRTLCHLSREQAEDVIEAGPAAWLLGPPKDEPAERAETLSYTPMAEAKETAVLPYDVTVGAITFRKGVELEIFIDAARRWYRAAVDAQPQPDAGLIHRALDELPSPLAEDRAEWDREKRW